MRDNKKNQWESKIIADSIKLRCLLHEIDSLKTPLWTGEALFSAVFRYVEIFLPMYAAYLHGERRIKLNSDKSTKVFLILEGAKSLLLSMDNNSSKKEKILENISRSMYFGKALDLLKQTPTMRPIPAIDVGFCWTMHRLSTPDYVKDCKLKYGDVLPGGCASSEEDNSQVNGLDYIDSKNIETLHGTVAQLQWYCFARSVYNLETKSFFRKKLFQSGYMKFLPSHLYPIQDKEQLKIAYNVEDDFQFNYNYEYPLTYNLVDAAQRQKNFFFNVSIPYFDDRKAIERGAERYRKFLGLMKTTVMYFVPLYDIDLAWHAHILRSTEAYKRDTMELTGRFINHQENDNREAKGKLANGFERTRALWKKEYGEEYADEYTQFKGWVPRNEMRVFPYSRGEI